MEVTIDPFRKSFGETGKRFIGVFIPADCIDNFFVYNEFIDMIL